ncbi:hypothetical protein BGY98DRAFT_1175153 [Russula aff. rugulosa BPL654]|nr:hypothetical protein BGY98DRAFT_1175153 [Russula aff. rugulosa BPL654]
MNLAFRFLAPDHQSLTRWPFLLLRSQAHANSHPEAVRFADNDHHWTGTGKAIKIMVFSDIFKFNWDMSRIRQQFLRALKRSITLPAPSPMSSAHAAAQAKPAVIDGFGPAQQFKKPKPSQAKPGRKLLELRSVTRSPPRRAPQPGISASLIILPFSITPLSHVMRRRCLGNQMVRLEVVGLPVFDAHVTYFKVQYP